MQLLQNDQEVGECGSPHPKGGAGHPLAEPVEDELGTMPDAQP
jgi:hypothetical protein